MIWLSSEFRHVVLGRLSEWQCAITTMLFGVVLLAPAQIYEQSPAWAAFHILISETNLGMLMFVFGVFRVTVLGINGFWRPTYYLRAVGASLSMAVWLMITFGFWSSGYLGTWAAVYPMFAFIAGVNTFRAMDDAKHMEIARRASRAFTEARHAPSPG